MAFQPLVTTLCILSMVNGQSYNTNLTNTTNFKMADITSAIASYSDNEQFQLDNLLNNIEREQGQGKNINDIIKGIEDAKSVVESQPLTTKIDTSLLVRQVKANAPSNVVDSITQDEQSSIRQEEQTQLEQIKSDNSSASSSQIDSIKAKQEKEQADKLAYIANQKEELAKQQNVRKIQTGNDPAMDYSDYYIATSLNQEEYDMICAVVQAEAGGGTMEFREYVAGVIYNRLHSPYYPGTIYDVLHAPNQFTTISNYETNYAPVDDITRQAVSRIFDGVDLYILYNLQYASAYCNPYTSSAAGFAWFKKLDFVFEAKYPESDPNTRWVHWFYTV